MSFTASCLPEMYKYTNIYLKKQSKSKKIDLTHKIFTNQYTTRTQILRQTTPIPMLLIVNTLDH